ncbi:family 20 glycosylhydrolase [Dinghuibacter silviterrae]|uniref:beta-N-acetylhexosaminidase n=1 Tax=Dinghuibacter silviterrae TaxID=1539049 RepID=A0A4R8DS24_9BACT|nr:family 20 glycosylhydrolase [Dinghuibacter silviterrae]TDX00809.1 hexosaminidase [Dinghuibacter silviterrae]
MRKLILPLLCSAFTMTALAGGAPAGDRHVSIIPAPVSLTKTPGTFVLDAGTVIHSESADLAQTASWFGGLVHLDVAKHSKKQITLALLKEADTTLGKEGYTLSVKPGGVTIKANTPAGVFYGLQTLLQMIDGHSLPCAEITDYPRFGWRGLMLDVSRHFFTKTEVERYIDEMARYKFNTFHWHLSDDNGWRIEIKSLPELTQKGAWRVSRSGRWGTFLPPLADEPTDDGGFYTQEDIKEILAYAKARFITVLPEIDVPAHSLALISAYPNLSCTQLPYPVNPGSRGPERQDNVLCVGNDSVYEVLQKIFTEIAALFPNPYIHIGGDEAFKGFWANCPKCRHLMEQEHLKDVDELQSYFVKRMEKMLNGLGKKLIGWDEILEGGLAPSATVMSWRGMAGGITAARMGHEVVMTPWDYAYLDLYQGDPAVEPPTYGLCRLTDCYKYDPVPDSVDPRLIIGGQGNLWTESVPTFRHAEYMTWPRSLALAEVYWSPKAKRNWDDFTRRMEAELPRLDAAGINYARSAFDAVAIPGHDKLGRLAIRFITEIKGLDIYYTFDNTRPDSLSAKYQGEPLEFPKGAAILTVITYRDGKPIGERISLNKDDLEKRSQEKHHVY